MFVELSSFKARLPHVPLRQVEVAVGMEEDARFKRRRVTGL